MTATEELPQLRFRLPGDWWAVELHDRDRAVAAAHRLVRHRVGAHDDRALLRARLTREFTETVDAAIRAGGQSMFIAVQILDGVPLPISFTVYLPELGMTPAIGTAPDGVLDILDRGLEHIVAEGHADPGDPVDRVRIALPATKATRLHRVRVIDVGSGDDSGTLETLIVDYWVAIPGTKRVLLVTFTTSLAALQEQLLQFFDAVMRAAAWDAPGPPESPSATLPG
ncbi:hypothetical protein [Protaetiibacter larvae]|uniref:Uncharacterized protein n=1 Tax=Protaetiibacter larvae TaxID=2592654 RepID=A0A5C1Y986_9MICO|nr:hypothetical protein [Protaetiibacter larvae]QEO10643.1 hypothetical protein FLP23_11890 [Protaetiibacter larvae]